MKKILSFALAFLISNTVYAEKLIVTYDRNNKLSAVSRYEDGRNYDVKDGFSAIIYDMDKETKEKYEPIKVSEEIPQVSPLPEPDNPADTETEIKTPEIYETGKDAISAFAVVKSISQVLLNDETVWKAEVLYQGRECDFYIYDDVKITSAPDYRNELLGSDAGSLKRGDVINVVCSLSGRIYEIGFITRIEPYDIITDDIDYGYSFESLISCGGYVQWDYEKYPVSRFGERRSSRVEYQFGLVCKKNERFYTVTNKAGKESEMIDIPILPETIVYMCDVNNRYKIELGMPSDIRQSYIPGIDMDNSGNIINWSDDTDYVYALSRTINGVASDVIVFYNIKK